MAVLYLSFLIPMGALFQMWLFKDGACGSGLRVHRPF